MGRIKWITARESQILKLARMFPEQFEDEKQIIKISNDINNITVMLFDIHEEIKEMKNK